MSKIMNFLKSLFSPEKDRRTLANQEGAYSRFTGKIAWGLNFARVENAWFKLVVVRKHKVIIWDKGSWIDGNWNMGYWHDGSWNMGYWCSGYWDKGTWRRGFDKMGLEHLENPSRWNLKKPALQ